MHPKYQDTDGRTPPLYDAALLKLANPVQFTDHISPVCLPNAQDEDLPNAGTAVLATGWGRTKNERGAPIATKLQQISVPLVTKQKCNTFLRSTEYEKIILCIGYDEGGKLICNGDSGGPAVVQDPANNNAWKLIGLADFTMGNAQKPCNSNYSGFARVSAFIEFIKQYVKDV